MQKWIILIIVIIICIIAVFIGMNTSIETEYIPESEIEEVELRKTIITLYFKDKVSGNIAEETRLIDSKTLLEEAHTELIKLLMIGPENENFEKILPEGISIIECNYQNNCVIINFSKELKNANLKEIDKENIKTSIYNTLTQLKEVDDIKILVEGEEYF